MKKFHNLNTWSFRAGNGTGNEIQKAIDQFYVWLARLVDEARMNTGQRLGSERKTVSRKNIVTDGPLEKPRR